MTGPSTQFASDNHAGVHPAVLAAIAEANEGYAPAYGDDAWTARMRSLFVEHLGDVDVFPVFNGTGANVTGLAAVLHPHEAVVCTETAHVHVDECGAPERFTGSKLLALPAPGGKLTPAAVSRALVGFGDQHHVQPRVVSITQSTELGTVYSPDEIGALAELAHAHGMLLHVDGSRIANAAAVLGGGLRATTRDAGVDVLSFGGTKNGLLAGEAVVFFRRELAERYLYARKSGMQLASKMRFVSAQLARLLEDDLWLANARHANAMARRLADGLDGVPGVSLDQPVQANAVFARAPAGVIDDLRREFFFHVWDARAGVVRWMCSWQTEPGDVDRFLAALRRAAAQPAPA